MVVPGEEIFIKKRVLYIGSSVPLETSQGLEAVQQPLRDRYSSDESDIQGIDAYVSVTSSGLQIQYVEDPSTIILFPITALTLCAAVRRVKTVNGATGENSFRFVSLSSPQAKGLRTPAIFTAITRRTKGRKVLECHGFICPNERIALDLVKATSTVDKGQKPPLSARSSQGFEQQSLRFNGNQTLPSAVNGHDINGHGVHLLPGDVPSAPREASNDFYDEPPAQGYFYTSSKTEVKSFNVEKENVQPSPRPVPERGATVIRTDGPPIIANSQTRVVGPPPLRPSFIKPVPPPVVVSQRPPPPVVTEQSRPPPPVVIKQPPPPQPIPPPPRLVSPPPPMMRAPMFVRRVPRHFSPPPRLGPYPPYMMMPPPPPPIFVRRPRRRSVSSGSHSSRDSSPAVEETVPKRVPNGDIDSESDFSRSIGSPRRPQTPPRDYDFPPERLSRRDQYEKKRNRSKHRLEKPPPMMMGPPPFLYGPPPPGYVMPPYPGYPVRSRSVPPPMRYPTGQYPKGKKSKKSKKGKKKRRTPASIISTDHESYGYASEIPISRNPYPYIPMEGYGNYHSVPRRPRDFRESQFMNERNFSKRIAEETRRSEGPENFRTAYELNDPGNSGDTNIQLNDGDFTMY